jgi:XTP/dITP diphosphohydrolase
MDKGISFPWQNIVLATKNKGKVKEFTRLLASFPAKVLTTADFPDLEDVVEDGATFEANAVKKAETISRETGFPALADDSGLEVDALQGKPGVYSARFAGLHGDDRANNEKLVSLLKNVPSEERQARFVSVLAFAVPGEKTLVARGTCEGQIVLEPAGEHGFGYDPFFYLPDKGCTMAELLLEEKNKISQRGQAMDKLKSLMEERFS